VIWDTVIFDDELDMLECRLTELAPVVDRFVVCEATRALSDGAVKPLVFEANRGRFGEWAERITYVVADLPAAGDAWERERVQRDAIAHGLGGAAPDDLILLSDVDEIPTGSGVYAAAVAGHPVVFEMTACYFAVDWVAPWPWLGTAACRYKDAPPLLSGMRDARQLWPVLYGAGWHLSWLGGPEGIRGKLAHRAHADETAVYLEHVAAGDFYERGLTWRAFGGELVQMDGVEVDDAWPEWVAQRRCPQVWFRPR
jgi:beta-1,4-mannosyl-glycoprotein beta-1,4-N-acetylglucosaminyltransferase